MRIYNLSTETKWSLLSFCLLLLSAAVVFFYMHRTGQDVGDVIEKIGKAGLIPFMAAMVFLPLLGFPVTPFYLLGGASFGNVSFLLATTMSLTFNLCLAYFLGNWMLAPLFDKSRWEIGKKARHLWLRRRSWIVIFLIRVGPGTVNMKDYLLGALRAPLIQYFLVSWPVCMAYAVAFIIMGDAAHARTIGKAVVGGIILMFIVVFTYVVKKRLEKKRRI